MKNNLANFLTRLDIVKRSFTCSLNTTYLGRTQLLHSIIEQRFLPEKLHEEFIFLVITHIEEDFIGNFLRKDNFFQVIS